LEVGHEEEVESATDLVEMQEECAPNALTDSSHPPDMPEGEPNAMQHPGHECVARCGVYKFVCERERHWTSNHQANFSLLAMLISRVAAIGKKYLLLSAVQCEALPKGN
jgi:hypothetical protein